MRLLTIPISHFCERARWALDHARINYVEQPHLQMLHWPFVKRFANTKTVPVLVTTEGQILTDSRDIVCFANETLSAKRSLYPNSPSLKAEVDSFEQLMADSFGVETRRLMYHHMFAWGAPALRYNGAQAPLWERWSFRMR